MFMMVVRVAVDMMVFGLTVASAGNLGAVIMTRMMQGGATWEELVMFVPSAAIVGVLLSPIARRVTQRPPTLRRAPFLILACALLCGLWGALLVLPAELFAYAFAAPVDSMGDPFTHAYSYADAAVGKFLGLAPHTSVWAAVMGAIFGPAYAWARSVRSNDKWSAAAALHVFVGVAAFSTGALAIVVEYMVFN